MFFRDMEKSVSSQPTEATDIESAFGQLRMKQGERVGLVIGYQHNTLARELTFILSVPLPREHEARYFEYGKGNEIARIGSDSSIKNPRVALCKTLRVRQFLNELNKEYQMEVLFLSLSRVVVRYREGPLNKDRVIQIFARVCASTYGLSEDRPMIIAPLPDYQ